MYPDNRYATPRSSFERPIPVPIVDPDAAPTLALAINCSWLPIIRGALMQLLLQSTWATTSPSDLLLTQQRASNLIAMLTECASALPFACPFDFSTGDNGWTVILDTSFTPPLYGFYSAGVGFVAGDEVSNVTLGVWGNGGIERSLGGSYQLTSMDMTFDFIKGTFSGATNGFVAGFLSGALAFVQYMNCQTRPDGSGQHLVWSGGPIAVDFLQCLIVTHVYPPGMGIPGSGTITKVEINGVGLPPC